MLGTLLLYLSKNFSLFVCMCVFEKVMEIDSDKECQCGHHYILHHADDD